MNEDSKKFFEELSNGEETELEPQVELAKATSLPTKSKPAAKKDADASDWLEDGEGQLTIDVYQNPNEIVVESTIAGVDPENLDVNITPDSVTIRGKREKERKIADEDYFYQECYWGKFSRSVILPQEVNADESEATLKNGVLTIRMPKINRQKSKKLKVSLN
jgi:HSP20 family molecular chaperone IbpA